MREKSSIVPRSGHNRWIHSVATAPPRFLRLISQHRVRKAAVGAVVQAAIRVLAVTCAFALLSGARCHRIWAEPVQPNVVVLMVDDMGFSDLGCYGSEIDTPNLDALAAQGIRFTKFYNTGRCTPSRASLLTGQTAHRVGVGRLNGPSPLPGYLGQLDATAVTLSEVLHAAGYQTYMVGKWHLTQTGTYDDGPNGSWPQQRGFSEFYGTMEGAKDYYEPENFFRTAATEARHLHKISDLGFDPDPRDNRDYYYFTDDITQKAADMIRRADPKKPIILYAAFYGPHFPLQAPGEVIDKYLNLGSYAVGPAAVRQRRLARQIDAKILPPGATASKAQVSNSGIPTQDEWDALAQAARDEMELRMAVYAANIETVDQGVGRIVNVLRATSRLNNTIIFFLSDNGGQGNDPWRGRGSLDHVSEAIPGKNIQIRYGEAWANVSNTPFREFKGFNHEGGIASPLIVGWPDGIAGRQTGTIDTRSRVHITDIMPTILDVARIVYPGQKLPGVVPAELEGISLVQALAGTPVGTDRLLFWEHEGSRAASDGEYKVVARKARSDWELYRIASDRIEAHNLAKRRPEQLAKLVAAWEDWAQRNRVIPWPYLPPYGSRYLK